MLDGLVQPVEGLVDQPGAGESLSDFVWVYV